MNREDLVQEYGEEAVAYAEAELYKYVDWKIKVVTDAKKEISKAVNDIKAVMNLDFNLNLELRCSEFHSGAAKPIKVWCEHYAEQEKQNQ